MKSCTVAVAALALLASSSEARPHSQIPFQAAENVTPQNENNQEFNYLHHMSANSPYFESNGGSPKAPKGCSVTRASILARHSSINANDDEWPDSYGIFFEKFAEYDKTVIADDSPMAFLKSWKQPVNEEDQEQLTKYGAIDAEAFGKRIAELYKDLLSTKKDPSFKIFSASSSRDVDSAHAFIHGLYPKRTIGDKKGQVSLVKVPNKAEKWGTSLTPHKSCERFDKSVGKAERDDFNKGYAQNIISRLEEQDALPRWGWNWTDIVAMQQLCGYEIAINGSSDFCGLFTQGDWENFEYGQDLHYYYMLGRHNKWTAALGIPWIQIAVDKLNKKSDHSKDEDHLVPTEAPMFDYGPTPTVLDEITSKLPKVTQGPNATLHQPLHIWFTHREEVPLVTHALDLFHSHDEDTAAMPLDRINPNRVWKTSNIIPFLGHVSLERMECDESAFIEQEEPEVETESHHKKKKDKKGKKCPKKPTKEAFVRILVNGAPQNHPACATGPGGSCPLDEFTKIVKDLPSTYGDLETICNIDTPDK